MIEMVVESIRVSLMNYQRVVILKEKSAERYLPIWIGPAEADAIAIELQKIAVPRPLTHDLLRSIIGELGASVTSIVVYDLANDTYYARILMDVSGRHIEVDSRPSDAIALAVRVKAPIFAEESVLDRAGIVLDEAAPGKESSSHLDEKEIEKLSAFRDFINSLDLTDFDPKKQEDKDEN
ncbi:MAG: bifunctional nuclease family protein [Dehalococcoidia bacterium]|nr:bifunctional nuclease family protein [Dehalococcoidia bacterium]